MRKITGNKAVKKYLREITKRIKFTNTSDLGENWQIWINQYKFPSPPLCWRQVNLYLLNNRFPCFRKFIPDGAALAMNFKPSPVITKVGNQDNYCLTKSLLRIFSNIFTKNGELYKHNNRIEYWHKLIELTQSWIFSHSKFIFHWFENSKYWMNWLYKY